MYGGFFPLRDKALPGRIVFQTVFWKKNDSFFVKKNCQKRPLWEIFFHFVVPPNEILGFEFDEPTLSFQCWGVPRMGTQKAQDNISKREQNLLVFMSQDVNFLFDPKTSWIFSRCDFGKLQLKTSLPCWKHIILQSQNNKLTITNNCFETVDTKPRVLEFYHVFPANTDSMIFSPKRFYTISIYLCLVFHFSTKMSFE